MIEPVTADQMRSDYAATGMRLGVSLPALALWFAEQNGVRVGNLFIKTRKRCCSWPRQDFWAYLHAERGFSVRRLARDFGVVRKTVYHGIAASRTRNAASNK